MTPATSDSSESDEAESDDLAVTALLRTLDLRRSVRPRARLLLGQLSAAPGLAADNLPSLPSLLRDAAGLPRLRLPEPDTDLAICDLSLRGRATTTLVRSPSNDLVSRSTLGAYALGADGVLRVSHLDDALADARRSGRADEGDEGDEVEGGAWLPRELRSSSLVQCADRVDVIAPADNMKAFFKLLHTESAISLAVHRVGNTLVLEGLELDPSRPFGRKRILINAIIRHACLFDLYTWLPNDMPADARSTCNQMLQQ